MTNTVMARLRTSMLKVPAMVHAIAVMSADAGTQCRRPARERIGKHLCF